uniref:Uncharacterized protein n=1 Tax=Oryza sativa subsp. japonica TaxID=39947 RepID=Q2QZY9_ORYSJ|nr:hypothetical protein LOC_Os11g44370 [Oryza sativa Japonica Group]
MRSPQPLNRSIYPPHRKIQPLSPHPNLGNWRKKKFSLRKSLSSSRMIFLKIMETPRTICVKRDHLSRVVPLIRSRKVSSKRRIKSAGTPLALESPMTVVEVGAPITAIRDQPGAATWKVEVRGAEPGSADPWFS